MCACITDIKANHGGRGMGAEVGHSRSAGFGRCDVRFSEMMMLEPVM